MTVSRRPPNPVTLEAICEGRECRATGRNTYASFEEFMRTLDHFARLADEAEAGETIDVTDLAREARRALRRR